MTLKNDLNKKVRRAAVSNRQYS